MSALARYSRPIDGTIPVQALLYDDECLLASQDGIGLYDGPNKSPSHQVGAVHISSHRLFFISGAPSSSPLHAPLPDLERGASLILPLEAISHTESYAGFFKSSPKVTLHLRHSYNAVEGEPSSCPNIVEPTPIPGSSLTRYKPTTVGLSPNDISNPRVGASSASDNPFESWECEICGYRNPPGLSPSARSACGLCGMPRAVSSLDTPSSSTARQANSTGSLNSTSRTDPLPVSVPQASSSTKHALPTGYSAVSYILSKSLPSSTASTPPPLTVSPPMTADEDGGRLRRRRPTSIACSVCTFFNHPYLRECEMCGTPLPSKMLSPAEGSCNAISDVGPTPLINSKSAPNSRPVSPAFSDAFSPADVDERERFIRLSFRKGGDKAFYAALKTALQQKKWEVREAGYTQRSQAPSGLSGINAILQNIDTTVLHTERGMSDAFEDLEALMHKAQDMVRLAKGLNEQLAAASRSSTNGAEPIEPEEATFIRSSLGQLGLNMKNTAVTAGLTDHAVPGVLSSPPSPLGSSSCTHSSAMPMPSSSPPHYASVIGSPIANSATLGLGQDAFPQQHANASEYTLATIAQAGPSKSRTPSIVSIRSADSADSDRAPLLGGGPDSSASSYGATMPMSRNANISSKRILLNVGIKMAVVFVISTAVLGGTLWLALPTLEEQDRPLLRVPKSFAQLQDLNYLLKKYRDIYPTRVVICYVTTYLFLQAFSLPGSMYLSILGGAVWGVPIALPLACTCVAFGATLSYLISAALGPALLTLPKWQARLDRWSEKIASQRANMLSYLIVLRIAPFPPHWVVNVLAPHLGIGVIPFWISTWLGIFGVTVIHTTIGGGLDEMTSAADFHLISWRNVLGLSAVVVGVLIPVGLRFVLSRRVGAIALPEDDDEAVHGENGVESLTTTSGDTILAQGPYVANGKGKTPTSAPPLLVLLSDTEDEEEDGEDSSLEEEEDEILLSGPSIDSSSKGKGIYRVDKTPSGPSNDNLIDLTVPVSPETVGSGRN